MYLRKHNGFELWGNAYPMGNSCIENPCLCKYHLVDEKRTYIESFDDWQEADVAFCKKSGAQKMTMLNINK